MTEIYNWDIQVENIQDRFSIQIFMSRLFPEEINQK